MYVLVESFFMTMNTKKEKKYFYSKKFQYE